MNTPRRFAAFLLALAAALPAFAVITEPDNHKVIFRYRAFSGTAPSYVSPLTSAGNISFAAGSSDIVTTDRGAGFDDLIVTDFDGSTEFLQGAAALNTTDSAGETNFSVETWFKADSVTGVRALFSNTESNHGFALKLENGRLRGYVRFKNGATPVPYIIDQEAAYPNLNTGRWYYAVLHCRKLGSLYEIKLYLDGVRVAYVTTSGVWNGVYQSTEKPMIGAEPGGGTASGDYFDGQIYAVVVSNHGVFLDNYVKVKVVRDGGRYFGSPSYHDYLDTTASVDFRLDETSSAYADVGTKQVDRMINPFVNDGYIPQTISYAPSSGYFYVSSYWRDVDGSIASATNQPDRISILSEIDKATNSLRRVFRLFKPDGTPNYGHVGALAHHNGNVYISYGTYVYRYSLASAPNPGYIFNPQTFANPRGDQNPLTAAYSINLASYIGNNTSVDCANISVDSNGDTILWAGDWDTVDIRKLFGFKINADGSIATPAVYSFNLPATIVNGIACYSTSATDVWFYILSAGGDNPSYLRRVRYLKSSPTPQSSTVVFTGPAGEEGLTMVGTQVWATSESGGRFYQSRTASPWTDLYPFLYGIAP
jgi:hypothetical protein